MLERLSVMPSSIAFNNLNIKSWEKKICFIQHELLLVACNEMRKILQRNRKKIVLILVALMWIRISSHVRGGLLLFTLVILLVFRCLVSWNELKIIFQLAIDVWRRSASIWNDRFMFISNHFFLFCINLARVQHLFLGYSSIIY